MAKIPVITIQSDWNEVLRQPSGVVWISSKYLNENSIEDKITTSINKVDGKINISFSDNYQYLSHNSLSLVVKHINTGIKVAFVAATKVHNIHSKAILSVSAAENALTVSSCEGDKLLVWDSRTSETLLDLKGHGGPIYKCKFFPSGIVLLSAGADGSCRIWSAESGINPVTLKGHIMSVTDISIIDKGRNIISVSKDGSAKLWDVGESKCLDNILEEQGPINCCALAMTSSEYIVVNEREVGTNNKLLVAGCESGLITCSHVAKREQQYCQQLDSACNACIVAEETIIVGCSNGKILQLSLHDGRLLREWHDSASPVLCLAALPSKIFAVGRQDGTCTIVPLQEAQDNIRVQLTGSDCDGIRDIAFNGKWLFVGCRDSNIRKYDYNQITVHFK